ncbi:MAG: class I SAM-dependent methyltransferase [Methylibium sp.]|nr:class I SAM-dependent methyltransferase [Methylibium sp.]MBA3598987.1 class I SAM-dependent methyltransferase [Methylibium sp.]
MPSRAAVQSANRVWRELHHAACAPYRAAGRFAWHFARGKLGHDPVFRALLQRGDVPAQARLLDIGCGQGLLASLLVAAQDVHARGEWPAAWADAPVGVRYTGIDLMARDIARAEQAASQLPGAPRFVQADMCSAELPGSDVVVILDVLHYVDIAAQDAVLARVRDALRPNGRLLLRIGDAADRHRFAASQWVDRIVTLTRGHRVAPTFGRPLEAWIGALQGLGFAVRSVPMSRGTPFANVLLIADSREQRA